MYYQIQQYIDALNDDYEILRNEYSGTELFTEVIHFLDWFFPNWKTNRGLGEGAPEFVLTTIRSTEDHFYDSSQMEALRNLYLEIIDAYPTSKSFFNDGFTQSCHTHLGDLSDDEFEDLFGKLPEDMSKIEFEDAWDSYIKEKSLLVSYCFEF